MKGILEGIRVIEWGAFHAGPGTSSLLGDLGAEVIKIEPKEGDPARAWTTLGDFVFTTPSGINALFETANRNKKSITLDLSKPEGKELLYRLVEKSDVFLTNHRKGAVLKQGLDYATLKKRNPRLVYAGISAFGWKGPDGDLGGFDFQGQARSGFMTAMGEPGQPPGLIQYGVIDQTTAIMTSYGIVAALLARERFGIGQEIHASLLGSATSLLHCNIVIAQLLGREVPKHGRSAPGNPLRSYYECQDGMWLSCSHTPSQKFWEPFCRALGLEELINNPCFNSDEARGQNSRDLVAILDRRFATKPRAEWLEIARKAKLNFAPVNTVFDLSDDPQMIANNYLTECEFPGYGTYKVTGFPVQFSETPARISCNAPKLGAETDAVLGEVLGLSAGEIDRLRTEGAI